MKAKRISFAIVLVLICVLLTACSTPEGTYKQAQTLLSQGKYTEAAEKFESLGSYEDATKLTMYCKACALCESGNFEAGIAGFESLGNYKDCSLRISYYNARSWDDNSVGTTEFEWMNRAKSIYNENPLYLDSAERITALDARIESAKKTLYDNAIAAAEQGQYSTAIATFQRLGNYKDSAQRATYYGIRADEDALAGTTNETAYDAVAVKYTNMGSYLDCADRAAAVTAQATAIRDEKYDAAVARMNEGKYAEAIAAFKGLDGYKDSSTQIYICVELGVKTASAKGFQSNVVVNVIVDAEGKIASIEVDSSNETPGFGTRCAEDEAFLNQFIGLTLPLTDDVDVLSGATVTSNAVIEAVNQAALASVPASSGVTVTGTATGFQSDVTVTLTVENGAIASIEVDSSNETPGFGTRCAEDEAFLNQFIGLTLPLTDDVDVLSGATVTSNAVINVLKNMEYLHFNVLKNMEYLH